MIGGKIHHYNIQAQLGEGGMGTVYLGIHERIKRRVAIKVLNPLLAKNETIKERFRNEAATLSQLQHPNIGQLYDYIEENDTVSLVMEFVEGSPLDVFIETVTGPIPEELAVQLFAEILDGVQYAHEKQIVHRDIKPSNFIITAEKKVKILDFGIAKILGDPGHQLTKTGTKIGTVFYMSPEQVKGEAVGIATDIYSLGVTLFQMVTGKCPYYNQTTEYEIYKKIVEEPLPDATDFYVGVSQHIKNVIHKATAKNIADRYSNCAEFKQALLNSSIEQPVKNIKNDFAAKTVIKQSFAKDIEPEPVKNKVVTKKPIALLVISLITLIISAVFFTKSFFASEMKSPTNEKFEKLQLSENKEFINKIAKLDALNTVKYYINSLGERNFSEAYFLCKEDLLEKKGGFDWYSSAENFGETSETAILKIEVESETEETTKILTTYYRFDPVNGNQYNNERFELIKDSTLWKISNIELLNSTTNEINK